MAGEIEGLSHDEPLARRIARHDYDRLIMLSDGVFAIAITLLAIELPVPEAWNGKLASLQGALARPLFGYFFAFGLIGAFWIAHRRLLSRVVRADLPFTLLGLLQLGFVGLVPLVARLIAENGPTRALNAYLLILGILFLVNAGMMAVADRRGLLHREVERGPWRLMLATNTLAALLFGALGLYGLAEGKPLDLTVFTGVMVAMAVFSRVTRARMRAA